MWRHQVKTIRAEEVAQARFLTRERETHALGDTLTGVNLAGCEKFDLLSSGWAHSGKFIRDRFGAEKVCGQLPCDLSERFLAKPSVQGHRVQQGLQPPLDRCEFCVPCDRSQGMITIWIVLTDVIRFMMGCWHALHLHRTTRVHFDQFLGVDGDVCSAR